MIDTAKLKEKILDLAIRGKLVPQDPNDEPASVLLEKIRAEKLQMVKEGKLKQKDIKDDTVIFVGEDNLHYEKFGDGSIKCIEDEIPFDIPKSWAWTRLGNVFQHNTGKALNSSNSQGDFYSYITTSNVYWDKLDLRNVKEMLFTKEELDKYTLKKNDLLVCEGGDIGRAAIWDKDYEIRFQNHIHRLRPFLNLSIKFYYYVFYLYKHTGLIGGNGIGIQTLSSNKLDAILLPITTLNEQYKIVESIESNIGYINNLEIDKKDLLESINSLKSKILDLAIRGKLVSQDPNDEPADALLERIRKEKEELIKQGKIKRDKKESIIFKGDDNSYYEKIGDNMLPMNHNLPFEIPNTWCWIRLKDITSVIQNGASIKQFKEASGIPITRIETIASGDIDESRFGYANIYDIAKYSSYVLEDKDILMSHINSPKHLGKCALYTKKNPIIHGMNLLNIRLVNKNVADFIYNYFLTNSFKMFIWENMKHSVNQASFNISLIEKCFIPIPPLNEQKRIINKLNEIFSNANQIEKSLN